MGRSVKNARYALHPTGAAAPMLNGSSEQFPEGVTKTDSAQNIAGNVTRFSADDYTALRPVIEPPHA